MSQTDNRDALSQDRVFDLLSNARRRFVLHYLSERQSPVELRELADEVARWETGEQTLSRKQRKRVYVSLYQTHIPRLEDAGVITYDSETGMVELVDRARDIDRYVSSGDADRSWPLYYLAVAFAGLVIYAATVLDVPPFDTVSDVLGGLTVLLLLLALSVVHLFLARRRGGFQLDADQFVVRDEE